MPRNINETAKNTVKTVFRKNPELQIFTIFTVFSQRFLAGFCAGESNYRRRSTDRTKRSWRRRSMNGWSIPPWSKARKNLLSFCKQSVVPAFVSASCSLLPLKLSNAARRRFIAKANPEKSLLLMLWKICFWSISESIILSPAQFSYQEPESRWTALQFGEKWKTFAKPQRSIRQKYFRTTWGTCSQGYFTKWKRISPSWQISSDIRRSIRRVFIWLPPAKSTAARWSGWGWLCQWECKHNFDYVTLSVCTSSYSSLFTY